MPDWPQLLDALEERTRRLAQALSAGEQFTVPDRDLPDLDVLSAGQLPRDQELRARALLAETARLQALIERRRGAQGRAAAAYRSH